ncbi:MAG: STAS domain-containing protein [Candidatus Wallbacteria bacterium]|nr:STAS domain-containing protein [Candidatus Wallbacteria bacterium]
MKLEKREEAGVIIIEMHGDVERHEEDRLLAWLDGISAESPSRVVLNLGGLSYANSAVLGIIAKFYNDVIRRRGRLCACCLTPFVLKMFRVTHINEVIRIFSMEKEAVRSLL